MEWLTELIKHTPEILKAASANDLALAAFFFLVGAVLIFGLLRNASSLVKLAAIVIWCAASLVALLYFVHQKMPPPDYVVRIIGQDTAVKGHVTDLNLGFIEANAEHRYSLDVRREGSPAPLDVLSVDSPMTAEISHARDGAAGAGDSQTVTLKLTTPSTSGKQTSILRLGKSGGKSADGLTLRVFYTALPSPVPIHADSGPKSSGNGQDSSSNYTLCADAPAQGDYEVVSSHYWLTGDRECNHYSQCAPAPGTSGKQSCFVFNMQGHSECTKPFSNCAATRNSEGHIDASFRLIPSVTMLTAAAG
jgi:uncharacterized membrane protein YjfL (UPF0719 family)